MVSAQLSKWSLLPDFQVQFSLGSRQVETPIMVSFGVRQLFELWGLGWGVCTGWEQLSETAGLVPYTSDAVGRALWSPWLSGHCLRRLGLSTLFSSRLDYELFSLPWQGRRMGSWACMARVWPTISGKSVHWISWSGEVTGFTLQMWRAMGCALFSSVTVSRAVG